LRVTLGCCGLPTGHSTRAANVPYDVRLGVKYNLQHCMRQSSQSW